MPLKELRVTFCMAQLTRPPPAWVSRTLQQRPPLLRAYYWLSVAEFCMHLALGSTFRVPQMNNEFIHALAHIPDLYTHERIFYRVVDLIQRRQLGTSPAPSLGGWGS